MEIKLEVGEQYICNMPNIETRDGIVIQITKLNEYEAKCEIIQPAKDGNTDLSWFQLGSPLHKSLEPFEEEKIEEVEVLKVTFEDLLGGQ